jgi:hypothetical protein
MEFALLLRRLCPGVIQPCLGLIGPVALDHLNRFCLRLSTGAGGCAPTINRSGKFSELCFLPPPGYAPVPKEFQ